jgi:MFS family permease
VVILLGVGEVIGALLSAFLADRIGKRVVVMAGISWSRSRRALAAVAVARRRRHRRSSWSAGFELAFVSAPPLVVEVDESHRAMMGAGCRPHRRLHSAAVVGTWLFAEHGIDAAVVLGERAGSGRGVRRGGCPRKPA